MRELAAKPEGKEGFFSRFRKSELGSISVETALLSTVLLSIGIGTVDFGMGLERKMDMANAIRAGMQYALVRKPIQGDTTAIEEAVLTALVPGTSSSGTVLTSEMVCSCPDGTAMDCLGSDDQDLHCADGSQRGAYIVLTLKEDYGLMWTYPVIGQTLTITETASVRLN